MTEQVPPETLLDILREFSSAAVIVAAIIAALAAYILKIHEDRSRKRHKLASLKSAFYGEISAILSTIEENNYIRDYRYVTMAFQRGDDVKFPPHVSTGEFFSVYKNNVSDIGIFPVKMAYDLTNLYTRFFSVEEYLRTVGLPEWNALSIERKRPTVQYIVKQLQIIQKDARVLLKYINE